MPKRWKPGARERALGSILKADEAKTRGEERRGKEAALKARKRGMKLLKERGGT